MKNIFNNNILYGWRDNFHKYLPRMAKALRINKPQTSMANSVYDGTGDKKPTTTFKISNKDIKTIRDEVEKLNKDIDKKNKNTDKENKKITNAIKQANKDYKSNIQPKLIDKINRIEIPNSLKKGFVFKNDPESVDSNFSEIDKFFTNLITRKDHNIRAPIGKDKSPLYTALQNVELSFKNHFSEELYDINQQKQNTQEGGFDIASGLNSEQNYKTITIHGPDDDFSSFDEETDKEYNNRMNDFDDDFGTKSAEEANRLYSEQENAKQQSNIPTPRPTAEDNKVNSKKIFDINDVIKGRKNLKKVSDDKKNDRSSANFADLNKNDYAEKILENENVKKILENANHRDSMTSNKNNFERDDSEWEIIQQDRYSKRSNSEPDIGKTTKDNISQDKERKLNNNSHHHHSDGELSKRRPIDQNLKNELGKMRKFIDADNEWAQDTDEGIKSSKTERKNSVSDIISKGRRSSMDFAEDHENSKNKPVGKGMN